MKTRIIGFVSCLVVFGFAGIGFATVPMAVSPNSNSGEVWVGQNCPTFTWAPAEGAVSYQVAVFVLPAHDVGEYEAMEAMATPVIIAKIAVPALSWTPPPSQCLNTEGMNVWYVKGIDGNGKGVWSEGNKFVVGTTASQPETGELPEIDTAEGYDDDQVVLLGVADMVWNGMVSSSAASCPGCPGSDVFLENQEFPAGTNCECIATESITLGSGITIKSGAIVTFKAPRIDVRSAFHAEEGAVVHMESTSSASPGHITYTLGDQVYRIKAQEGAAPENISQALNALSPLPAGGRDQNLNISPDGKWLVLDTRRFDEDCSDWACLAVVAADFSLGDAVRIDGEVIHPDGVRAIASGGNLVVYGSGDGPHEDDLWAVSRSSIGAPWTAPVLLTGNSPYEHNYQPAVNAAGTKVLFECTDETYSGAGRVCEVGADGTGFRVVLTPADSPPGLPDTADLHTPDYAPDGSIVFEADWDGEQIWRLPVGATPPVKVAPAFTNDNSPCVLPDGSIASLWLNRPGGTGVHELKVMKPDGSSFFMLVINQDVADIGLGCGD